MSVIKPLKSDYQLSYEACERLIKKLKVNSKLAPHTPVKHNYDLSVRQDLGATKLMLSYKNANNITSVNIFQDTFIKLRNKMVLEPHIISKRIEKSMQLLKKVSSNSSK